MNGTRNEWRDRSGGTRISRLWKRFGKGERVCGECGLYFAKVEGKECCELVNGWCWNPRWQACQRFVEREVSCEL
jgi:hypothetical protein